MYGFYNRGEFILPEWAGLLKDYYWRIRVEGRDKAKRRRFYRYVEKEKIRLAEQGIDQNFDSVLKLKEIFIGANAEISKQTLTDHMINCRNVKVTKVRTGFKDFNVVTQRDRSLWYVAEDSLTS